MDNPEKLATWVKQDQKKNRIKTQHNMCWTPLFASKHKKHTYNTRVLLQSTVHVGKDEPNIVFMKFFFILYLFHEDYIQPEATSSSPL